jgi:bifunctional N-acetylglucosamine-1-phosphate-uridyltransferase/glucosamine-1-phosphate-acetyltransferase GlmU-like protein
VVVGRTRTRSPTRRGALPKTGCCADRAARHARERSPRAAIEQGADDILVIFGDTPLLVSATLKAMRRIARRAYRGISCPADPTGYGLITNGTD